MKRAGRNRESVVAPLMQVLRWGGRVCHLFSRCFYCRLQNSRPRNPQVHTIGGAAGRRVDLVVI